MNRFAKPVLLAAAVVLGTAMNAPAQQQTLDDPHVGYVYPAGGKAGTTFEVTVGGEFLKGVSEVHVSGGGVHATISKYFLHLTEGQNAGLYNKKRKAVDRLKAREKARGGSPDREFSDEEVMKETAFTDYEMAQMADYRKRFSEKKRQLNPQLMEEVTLQVTIDPKAPVGERELRLLTNTGMSNPLYFHVGKFPEIRETEPNDSTPDSGVGDLMPVVINGQIMPGDVDRFTFKAHKGMHLVAIAACRELIPYLADAVPGWFQGVLTLYDPEGNDVAFASSAAGFRQDPVLFYEVPKDGEYVIEIRDSIYRGREDFVYRLTLGELPYITSIFPLGGKIGVPVEVALSGWNLPSDSLRVDPVFERGRSIRPFGVRGADGTLSNRVPFAVDSMTEIMEREPNNTREEAQAVPIPSVINGRIDKPGDVDVFSFHGSAHEKIVAEVYGRRLGSPIDSLLKLTDDKGKLVAANDDYKDESLALSTHHADSRLVVTLPAAGNYFLYLSESQRKGGPEYVYRLQVRYPRPDFELRVVPSSLSGRPGETLPITVYVFRKDGHAEDIALELDKPPPGFKLSGAWVPGNLDKTRLTLTVPTTPTPEPIALEMIAHSLARGHKAMHVAVPAEAMTQAFAYQHVVPTKEWTVMVPARSTSYLYKTRPNLQFEREDKLKLPASGTTKMRISAGKFASEMRVELSQPPDGITVKSVAAEGSNVALTLQIDPAKAKPGLKGNLLFNVFWDHVEATAKRGDDGKAPVAHLPLGLMPALPFEVLAGK